MQKESSLSSFTFLLSLRIKSCTCVMFARLLLLFFAAVVFVVPDSNAQNGLMGGARYRKDHTKFEDLPFDDGDISYFLMYEVANEHAAWQIGADYAPKVTGLYGASADANSPEQAQADVGQPVELKGEAVDYVITPQLNLVLKDRIFRAGTGIMASYIKKEDGNHKWIYPYWQLELGLEFNLGSHLRAGASAYYLLDRWQDITKFRTGEIEYGAHLSYSF